MAPPEAHSQASIDDSTHAWLTGLASMHDLVIAYDAAGAAVFLADRPGIIQDAEAPQDPAELGAAGWVLNEFSAADARGSALRVLVGDFTEPEALQAETDLAKRNEELETCVRSVSHDLRSPLVSVLGFTRLLRDEFGDPIGRTGRHFLDRIEQAGRNMERLLGDMLELTRISETPNCAVHVHPIAVLDQLAAEKKIALDEAGIELSLPSEAPVIVCDRTRLYQVFSNLIGNAIQHMEPQSHGRIEVSITTATGGWEITVADNGPGIAEEDRARIFNAFQTAESRAKAPRKKPSGLGLAIVRKIVEAHEGRIRVESELGKGSQFIVWLPKPQE